MNALADVPDVDVERQPSALEPTKILLIDLENCPGQISDLLTKLGTYSQIVICYAQSGAKVPLDWLQPLSDALVSQRLKLIKMASVGKNAADFGICFYAGALMQQSRAGASFTVLSDDADLDHVVHLLHGEGRQAQRVGLRVQAAAQIKPKPVLPPDPPITSVAVEPATPVGDAVVEPTLATFCRSLRTHAKNRPGKEATLLNHLRSHFRQSHALADGCLHELVERKIIRVAEDGKIAYAESQLIRAALAL